MKMKLTLAALFISAITFAQCTKCKSLLEAAKNPTQVKSLSMNSAFVSDEEDYQEIPEAIFTLVNIEELYFTDFGATELPKEIGKLTKLKSLSFAGNSFETLPDEIYTLTNLKELILSDNNFDEEYLAKIKKTVKQKLPNTRLLID